MKKTLKISEETHKRLKKLGRKGETFDDIIKRLLPPKHTDPEEYRTGRMRKLEDLAKIAKIKKRREFETGKIEKTDTGWKVNLSENQEKV